MVDFLRNLRLEEIMETVEFSTGLNLGIEPIDRQHGLFLNL